MNDGSYSNKTINVCLSCDDNYAKYAGVVIASVLANAAPEDDLHFFILDGGIKPDNREKILEIKKNRACEINFVEIDNNNFSEYSKIKTHNYLSLATYYRLKLPTLLPNINRIIYFDCDIVVNSSLKSLFETQMGDYPVAGVKDLNRRMLKKNPSYTNCGMLVFDLAKMREQKTEEAFLNWTKEHADQIKMGDQEIINETLKGKIKIVDDTWNVQSSNFINRSSYTKNPKVIHFVAKRKPWHWASFSVHKKYYFKYLQFTPWRLNEKDFKHWTKDNKIASILGYLKYRPLFFLRPRYYEALFKSYIIPIFERKPVIKENTFLVCELCSHSHSEVVPGFVKYLLELNYHVSVLIPKERYKEGLFSRFGEENITFNRMSRKQIKEYFKNDSLEDVKGVMITTVGKICDSVHYNRAYEIFSPDTDRKKLIFVEHEAKKSADNGSWKDDLVTLRKLNYKNIKSVVVNPHYFGNFKATPKNEITNFVTVGAIKPNKKNSDMIINAVSKLIKKGCTNFKVTVIGKGNLKHLPKETRKYFDIKGRLPFDKMYNEIEKSDFFLMPYNEFDPEHIRYNTTGTSGNFQLIYGFLKPCILIKSFAPINGFNEENAVLYEKNEDFPLAMEAAINLTQEEYSNMQNNLKILADKIYISSKENLKSLIEKGANYE